MELRDKPVEIKNMKRFYVPKTAVFYFTDSNLKPFNEFSKLINEYTYFYEIGSTYKKENKFNMMNSKFYSWVEIKKNESRIMKPSSFFDSVASDIKAKSKEFDIAILVYKSNNPNVIDYINEISSILCKNDVFVFHFVVENFIQSEETRKIYAKLVKSLTRKKQVHVPIKEETIVAAYKNATIANRNNYLNLYINNLVDLFVSPFLDPKRNPDAFPRMKALFYQSRRNFESRVVSTMGYSDAKVDNVDLALIQALQNPMFAAAFDASNTFIVDVKMPFYLENSIERIKQILKLVVGEWKKFYINTSIGSFEYDKYCRVSIMAINVNESKLITDTTKISEYVNKIIFNVQETRKLFSENATKDILLATKEVGGLEK